MQSKFLPMLAGAALGLTGVSAAMAQNSTDEVRAVVSEMLADAESRSSLLAGGDAGHDGRFFIAGDGFRLNVGGLLQFRYVFNYWFFRARLTDSVGDSGVDFDYAYAGYKFANGWKVTFGQFKLPMLREELVSDSKQLTVDRSFTNAVFTQNYSEGIELAYEADAWRAFFAFSDGLDSANTDFNARENVSGFRTSGQAEYAFTGRGEYKFSGSWDQFEDFTSAKGSDFGFMVGAAAHWQQSDNTFVPNEVNRDTLQYTVDATIKGDSWNIFGAFIGRYQSDEVNSNGSDLNDFGAVVQGGWRFAENTELFGRWDAIFADSDRSLVEDNYNFLTVGLNQYYAGHAAKATIDFVYAFEQTTGLSALGSPDTRTGLLGYGDEGELAVRLQFQLVF
ncbi:MAG: OprO/OprP family phosphate-selective porin [Phycisphaerales bacterium]|nr:OprO/OprP family phosphate-selective porin [Phycisphaerales bacterium]